MAEIAEAASQVLTPEDVVAERVPNVNSDQSW
jgi:hypothetical protein